MFLNTVSHVLVLKLGFSCYLDLVIAFNRKANFNFEVIFELKVCSFFLLHPKIDIYYLLVCSYKNFIVLDYELCLITHFNKQPRHIYVTLQ